MEDFHFSSLHNRIGNFAFVIQNQETHYNRWLMVRFSEGRSAYVLKSIGQMMDKHFPGKAFDQFLLEDNLKEQYEASYKLSKVIRLFSLLSVLIAISGLSGLSLYDKEKNQGDRHSQNPWIQHQANHCDVKSGIPEMGWNSICYCLSPYPVGTEKMADELCLSDRHAMVDFCPVGDHHCSHCHNRRYLADQLSRQIKSCGYHSL
jgi:hypothetical protein